MSVTLVHEEKPKSIRRVTTTKNAVRDVESRIPSSPTYGEHCIPSRRRAVEDNLGPSLKSNGERSHIGEGHECFELDSVVKFREEYEIKLDGNPWKNFKRLLCGYQDLPFIILQNPTWKHVFEYEEMKQCRTVQWISDVLEEIGLTLEDVVIVDICSLFSDDDLDRMDKESQHTWDAVEKSYAMVEDILEFLNPSTVLSCQCVTRWGQRRRIDGRLKPTWEPADNGLARVLCSSQKSITQGTTKEIQIGSNSTLCVYGVHPRRLEFEDTMVPELRGAFKDVFTPCMDWFEREEKTSMVSEVTGAKSLTYEKVVFRTKADSPSPDRSIEVAVDEVDDETRDLVEQMFALKLSCCAPGSAKESQIKKH